MVDSPYTKQRSFQFRGPQSSSDYNERLEENFKDLIYLYNQQANQGSDLDNGFIAFVKDLIGVNQFLDDFESRLAALEAANNSIAFTTETQIDVDRFNSIPAYAVNSSDRCTYQSNYNFLTLPHVQSSSMSKIKFTNTDGTYTIPSSLETLVSPISTTADNSSAVVDTSQPVNAILAKAGKVWERNIITSSLNSADGAQCYLYIKIPNDLSAVAETNAISFTPFPLKMVDILEIAYSTDVNIALGSVGSQWKVLNDTSIYFNAAGAAGNIAPGAWTGDEIISSGPKNFYFDPKPVTAFRIKLRQKNAFNESAKFVYSYGLSKLDIRYDKFLDSGKTIIRFDAPSGDTISTVKSLTPQMWNIPEYLVSSCFSYRVIWETSYNSNTYTLSPVPFSKRVWIEVTLNKTPNSGTPSLSGLIMKYS
jgi:hypothetical protein